MREALTESQRNFLESRFRYFEKRSTQFVLIIIAIILVIHVFFQEGSWQEIFIKYTFRFSLLTVILFILAEFLKDLYFPILAKFIKNDESELDNRK